MKSLGVIETRGLVAAVQAVDAACKSAGVTCVGYRKVGSGMVSVCFEGEISAIHTAIDRGMAAAELIDPQVKSLTIARPERSVVEALITLKGHPPRAEASAAAPIETEIVASAVVETREPTKLAAAPAAMEDKNTVMRKGKKA